MIKKLYFNESIGLALAGAAVGAGVGYIRGKKERDNTDYVSLALDKLNKSKSIKIYKRDINSVSFNPYLKGKLIDKVSIKCFHDWQTGYILEVYYDKRLMKKEIVPYYYSSTSQAIESLEKVIYDVLVDALYDGTSETNESAVGLGVAALATYAANKATKSYITKGVKDKETFNPISLSLKKLAKDNFIKSLDDNFINTASFKVNGKQFIIVYQNNGEAELSDFRLSNIIKFNYDNDTSLSTMITNAGLIKKAIDDFKNTL